MPAVLLFSGLSAVAQKTPGQLLQAVYQKQAKAKGGRWYFAANGHAVYCYGPVMTMPNAPGGLLKVATFCRGDQAMVPLKD